MTVYDRFSSVLTKVDITLACSLPVYNNGNEILFFYSTEVRKTNSYTITGIKRAFSRNAENGIIDEIDNNAISLDTILRCSELTINPKVFDSDAEKIEDSYLLLYEEILKSIRSRLPLERSLCREFFSSFEVLVPSSQLREYYYKLGKDLFDLVKVSG